MSDAGSGAAVTIAPNLQSSLLCDDVRQERNGKFILIGLFDSIAAPEYPLRIPRLFMVSRWCSGAGNFVQKTRILKPDLSEALVEGRPIPFKLVSTEATATNVEVFLNAQFEREGTYWVEIFLDGDMIIRYPLGARLAGSSPPPAL
jgi:hypothetical protein